MSSRCCWIPVPISPSWHGQSSPTTSGGHQVGCPGIMMTDMKMGPSFWKVQALKSALQSSTYLDLTLAPILCIAGNCWYVMATYLQHSQLVFRPSESIPAGSHKAPLLWICFLYTSTFTTSFNLIYPCPTQPWQNIISSFQKALLVEVENKMMLLSGWLFLENGLIQQPQLINRYSILLHLEQGGRKQSLVLHEKDTWILCTIVMLLSWRLKLCTENILPYHHILHFNSSKMICWVPMQSWKPRNCCMSGPQVLKTTSLEQT